MTKRFYSSISKTLILIPGLILVGASALMLRDGVWPGLLITGSVYALLLHTLFNTWYEINGQQLRIKSGVFFDTTIEIPGIYRIAATNNPLNSPAASFRRLELRYQKQEVVLISPKERDSFIEALLHVHPGIEVKL